MTAPSTQARGLARQMIGTRADWRLVRPHIRRPRPGLSWIGPSVVLGSIAASWFAFDGATGDGGNSVAFGFFIGATSILLMAWSFLLAVRIPPLEPLFGGLDRMYRVHRWAGALAIGAMYLHTEAEPEMKGGFRGASRSLANSAEDLAETAQTMLYVLVGISLIRWFPYRFWRWTHKLLGIPFALACFHFFTARKPYPNSSGWGWWFGAVMLIGLGAYVVRVVGRDMVAQGSRHRVVSAAATGSSLDLRLEATGSDLEHRAGQFAVIKIQKAGLREPHLFTIASSPDEPGLRFLIKDLGDWSHRLMTADLIGTEVFVEGPYGRFAPFDGDRTTVWVAGGVGITPFLAAATMAPERPDGQRPVLLYCVSNRGDAMGLDVLEAAEAEGRIDLDLIVSSEGRRFDQAMLLDRFGERGLIDAHVAACGPTPLVNAVDTAARSLGAAHVEHEDFDIRQGFGPNLSRLVR